jgi:hypothetical protein
MARFARHAVLPFALAAILLISAAGVDGVGMKAPCNTCTCHGEDQSKSVAPTLTCPLAQTWHTFRVCTQRRVPWRRGRRRKRTMQDLRVAWAVRPTVNPRDMSDEA